MYNKLIAGLKWFLTHPQNWQTLFGVYCHALPNSSPTPSLSEPAFKVRSISSKAHTISINSPSWEADSMSGGLLLGSVEVCVVAWVASVKSGGKEKYELRLNLGFKEYLYLPVTVQGSVFVDTTYISYSLIPSKYINDLEAPLSLTFIC